MIKISAVLLLWMSLLSCTTIQKMIAEEPKVDLKEVSIAKVSWTEVEFNVVLDVYNPNRFDLDLTKLEYQVSALDMVIGEGQFNDRVVVPAKGSQVVTLPLKLKARSALELAKRYMTKAMDITAILKGGVTFETPVGPLRLTIEEEKKITKPNET